MTICNTYWVKLFIGLKRGYTGTTHTLAEVQDICKKFCDENKVGVTIESTKYVYPNGEEDGVIVGFINYPRFPKSEVEELDKLAVTLGYRIARVFGQQRFTLMNPNLSMLCETEFAPDEDEIVVEPESYDPHMKPGGFW